MSPESKLPACAPSDNGLAEGEYRRDQAHALLQSRRSALVRKIQRALLAYLLERGPATSDAIRPLVPIPAGVDPRVVGAAVRSLALDRLIVTVGRDRSRRSPAHARWLDVWAIRDQVAALIWLDSNPDFPDGDSGCNSPRTPTPHQPDLFACVN